MDARKNCGRKKRQANRPCKKQTMGLRGIGVPHAYGVHSGVGSASTAPVPLRGLNRA